MGWGVPQRVSIHAPVMDAKIRCFQRQRAVLCFNPRARDGRECWCCQLWRRSKCFNPRARDGREVDSQQPTQAELGFNPRARDGRE